MDSLREFFGVPHAWDATRGLGQINTSLYGAPYQIVLGALARLGADFSTGERIVFFIPFAFLPFLAMYVMMSRFTQSPAGKSVAAALYGLNTYILVAGNNQLTIAMAYAFAPLVLAKFIDSCEASHDPTEDQRARWRASISAGVWLAMSGFFEPRIAFLTSVVCLGYFLFEIVRQRHLRGRLVVPVVGLLCTFGALHAYWILPLLATGDSSSLDDLLPNQPFISFATLTHAVTLNHPFWTGRDSAIFVVQPPVIFLFLLPVVCCSYFLGSHRKDSRLAFFAGLALVGVFLVKGENAPVGQIYTWMFSHVPGMRMFRDMSKFNLFVAVAYAVLAGAATAVAASALTRPAWSRRITFRETAPMAILVAVALAVGTPSLAALNQRLGGTFRPSKVPPEHLALERMLMADEQFGRVLHVPSESRYSYKTALHPSLELADLAAAVSSSESPALTDALEVLRKDELVDHLQALSVRYVVVDGSGEFGLWPGSDQEQRRTQFVVARSKLASRAGLQPLSSWPRRTVFGVAGARHLAGATTVKPRVATTRDDSKQDGEPSYRPMNVRRSPTGSYEVELLEPEAGRTVVSLSQAFDHEWAASFDSVRDGRRRPLAATHRKSPEGLNQWVLETPSGAEALRGVLVFRSQGVVTSSFVLSCLSALMLGAIGLWLAARGPRARGTSRRLKTGLSRVLTGWREAADSDDVVRQQSTQQPADNR
ncbi:MAG TPA: hypothetical protein VNA57_12885 [Acidimicrobiales bacterium]|nr:hypothetical protein [Acidimicrobiales bacterium]